MAVRRHDVNSNRTCDRLVWTDYVSIQLTVHAKGVTVIFHVNLVRSACYAGLLSKMSDSDCCMCGNHIILSLFVRTRHVLSQRMPGATTTHARGYNLARPGPQPHTPRATTYVWVHNRARSRPETRTPGATTTHARVINTLTPGNRRGSLFVELGLLDNVSCQLNIIVCDQKLHDYKVRILHECDFYQDSLFNSLIGSLCVCRSNSSW